MLQPIVAVVWTVEIGQKLAVKPLPAPRGIIRLGNPAVPCSREARQDFAHVDLNDVLTRVFSLYSTPSI